MTLKVSDKDADTNLVYAENSTTVDTLGTIAGALGGDPWVAGWNFTTSAPTTGAGSGTFASLTNAAMAANTSPITVYTGTEAEETDVNVTYNFATKADQKAGTYTDVITYTVSAN